MSSKVNFDHLVIAATDLSCGVDYVKQVLGVEMPYGGEHEKMGTHNHLMCLGRDCFIEVIAVNPVANQPLRPRWYGLDDPFVRQTITQGPRLIGWVVNTDNITNLLGQVQFQFGQAELISRGMLDWYFALPQDGRLLGSGLIPYVMQWNTDIHPATSMSDLGCRLQCLEIYHPQADWLQGILAQLNAVELVTVHQLEKNTSAYMTATIQTPLGSKQLCTGV